MAEVGIAASAIAVIQIAGKVASLAYGYIGALKRAPKDLQDLFEELGSFSKILSTLQDLIDNPDMPALHQLSAVQTQASKIGSKGCQENPQPLQACATQLEELRKSLEPKQGFRGHWTNGNCR